MPTDDAVLLAAAARAVLGGGRGSLTEQIDRPRCPRAAGSSAPLTQATTARNTVAETSPPPDRLSFWNGFGGFTRDGREYVIVIDGTSQARTQIAAGPLDERAGQSAVRMFGDRGWPWLQLGGQQSDESPDSLVERSGFGPVGEVIYLRDEETGDFWTPTPLPLGPRATVTIHHGQGYTRYAHVSHDLHQDLVVFVPIDDPIKLVCLTVRNDGDRLRRLTATYYAEWVLGTVRENAPLQVVCERDPESSAILARNAWAGAFAGKIAFAACGSPTQSVTADRMEFLGERGSIAMPAALKRVGLSGYAGSALDPCAAVTTEVTLAPGETREVVFALGQADSLAEVRRLIRDYTTIRIERRRR